MNLISFSDEHKITIQQYCQRYQTDSTNGLTQVQASTRLKSLKDNLQLSLKNEVIQKKSGLANYLKFNSVLLLALLVVSFIDYFADINQVKLYRCAFLIMLIIVKISFEYFKKRQTKEQKQLLKVKQIKKNVIVIRQGKEKLILQEQILVGDLLKITSGQIIPADIRIVSSNGMKVDNSCLTGETALLIKSEKCTSDNILQTCNIAFAQTINRQGTGFGLVIRTGDKTLMKQIKQSSENQQLEEQQEQKSQQQLSPLKIITQKFTTKLRLPSIIIGAVVFASICLSQVQLVSSLTLIICFLIVTQPKTMHSEITAQLYQTVQKMTKNKILIKNLLTVQKLGSTTCICVDKTGVLTQNKMTVANLWYNGKSLKADNYQKYGKDFKYQYNKNLVQFKCLQQTVANTTVAIFDKNPPQDQLKKIKEKTDITQQQKLETKKKFIEQWQKNFFNTNYLNWKTIGDASQSAFIKFFQPIQDIQQIRKSYPIIKNEDGNQNRLPFNSYNKFSFTINKYKTQNSDVCLFTKGTPQKLMSMCTHVYQNGVIVPKTAQWTQKAEEALKKFGLKAQRVLGFAKLHLDKQKFTQKYQFDFKDIHSPNFPLRQQVFVGLISLKDPPRDNVPSTIQKFRSDKIKVAMVTGDQKITATTVARQCNIIKQQLTVQDYMRKDNKSFEQAFQLSQAIQISGQQLIQMPQKDLQKRLLKKQIVLARMSPSQKVTIVNTFKNLGQIVLFIGDGVNDAAAIKNADIGIAFGEGCSQVCKQAADIIILDHDFSHIAQGIQLSKQLYASLKRSIVFNIINKTIWLLPFIMIVVFKLPVFISVTAILMIDFVRFNPYQTLKQQSEPKPQKLQKYKENKNLSSQHLLTNVSLFVVILVYFLSINDFGFSPLDFIFKSNSFAIQNLPTDIYDSQSSTFGNSKLIGILSCQQFQQKIQAIDWLYSSKPSMDLRMSAVKCDDSSGKLMFTQIFKVAQCKSDQISLISNTQICYTTQASKYGQSAIVYSIIVCHIFEFYLKSIGIKDYSFKGLKIQNLIKNIIILAVLFLFSHVKHLNLLFDIRNCGLISLIGYTGCLMIVFMIYGKIVKTLIKMALNLKRRLIHLN